MHTRRPNAITELESVVRAIDPCLSAVGFSRSNHLFYRSKDEGFVEEKIEGISLRFEYGFRTCWLHPTAKFPRLIELLSEVRPYAYKKELSRRVPDYASHIACMLRLADLCALSAATLPKGLRQREDGRLQRARSVPAKRLADVLLELIQEQVFPALQSRLTLSKIAAASERPGYPQSGAAGAWPLAAKLALHDLEGASHAFARHPYSLGADERRFEIAREWLLRKGVDVNSVKWSQADADNSNRVFTRPWLSGSLVQ